MTSAACFALRDLAAATSWRHDEQRLELIDGVSGIASRFPVSDMAGAAYGALALAAAELMAARGGPKVSPVVDRRQAGLALAGNTYLTIDGVAPVEWDPLTGYYQCADGGWVYLHGNFPHHRDGLVNLFNVTPDQAAMAAKLGQTDAITAETRGQEAGLCVMMLRNRDAWETHEQYHALRTKSVVEIAQIHPGAGKCLPPSQGRPLTGVRVLDLSRVIAGPMAGRALAELGADVLRVGADGLPYFPALSVDTGFGKRWCDIDLRQNKGRNQLRSLIAQADVVIDGFRPGALSAKGFSVDQMIAANPDLIIAELSAFSDIGPWAGRRGYDSYVQSGVGLTAPVAPHEAPIRLPCQPLDYLSGCLLAFGVVRALTRRQIANGGGFEVEVSLARTAMWFWDMADMLGDEPAAPDRNLTVADARAENRLRRISGPQGAISALAPPFGFHENRLDWTGPPPRPGADQPVWLSRM